jgi:type II secretory pathway component PulF
MSRYRYRAARADGAILGGVVTGATQADAVGMLVAHGLHPLRFERVVESEQAGRPASRHDLAVFFRSLASLVSAGVPIARALTSTAPAVTGRLRASLPRMQQSLREGLPLSSALEREDGLIPTRLVSMVRAGEHASRLTEALDQASGHLEQEVELLGRVRQALLYPMVLTVTGFLSLGVIAFAVLPRFASLLADLGQDLPWTTRALLSAASISRTAAPILPLALVGTAALVAAALRHPGHRLQVDSLLLRAPGLGGFRHTLASARWLHALAAMLGSGLPVLAALDTAGQSCGDHAISMRTRAARERVARGEPITAALEQEAVLTAASLQVLAIGEASGQLALMARRAGDLAASDASRSLRQLVGLLEPMLVLAFGGIVAFVAAALLQAVYSLRPGG